MKTFKYKDFNLNFLPHPNTGDLSIVKEENSVKQSIRNIILTDYEERPFQPKLGGNIRALLFENPTQLVVMEMKSRVENLIRAYEKRADLSDVQVKFNIDNNAFDIKILFKVVTVGYDGSFGITLNRIV
jgi:phage baseplate assembly protein W